MQKNCGCIGDLAILMILVFLMVYNKVVFFLPFFLLCIWIGNNSNNSNANNDSMELLKRLNQETFDIRICSVKVT